MWERIVLAVCYSVAVEMYLEFACCAAVPGGGRNKEYALHLLHMCHGNIHVSVNSYQKLNSLLVEGDIKIKLHMWKDCTG
jgi:hypothetical protein